MRFIKLTGLVLGSLLLVNAASAAAQVIVQVRPPRAFVERRGHPPGPGSYGFQAISVGTVAAMCGHRANGDALLAPTLTGYQVDG